MTHRFNKTAAAALLGVLLAGLFVASAFADTRATLSARDVRGDTGRTVDTAPAPTPTPPPAPTPTLPPAPQGGITSSTNGSVSTGGNQGGEVVTGDEHVLVVEVNIGPTNPSQPQVDIDEDEGEAPTPPSVCSDDRRASNACPIEAQPRAR